ncbi:MAG: flagellar biosynthesis anti-sigma factor FlgM [Deltaproteobacteria bacterium]|nr:flagellar biosynthesis anti-sigma factor FlgM [Deltaproteobacteria bacterium]
MMKIHGGKPPENADVVKFQKTGQNGAAETTGQSKVADKVDLSGKAWEIAEIMGVVKSLPEVRTEKVSEIKELIDSGKYVVEPGKVAQRMMDEVV